MKRMRRVALVVVVLGWIGAPGGALADGATSPRIEFSETRFDFVEVDEGQQVVHRFRFRNVGTADLHVGPISADSIRAYCALPEALQVTPAASGGSQVTVVRPGEWGEIVAAFNSEGFALPGFDGRITQHINVYSDDLSRPRVALEMSGRVKGAVIPDPPMLVMGNIYKADGDLPTHLPPVEVMPAEGQSFQITKAETNSPFLHPTVTPLEGQRSGGYVVRTAIDPAIPEGRLVGAKLVLHTTHPKKPLLTIPIVGEVLAARRIGVLPMVAQFNFLKPGEERSLALTVGKSGGPPWELLRAEAQVWGAPVQVVFRRAGADYEVTLAVKAPADGLQGFLGYLDLFTSDPHSPKVTVLVKGWTYALEPFSAPGERLRAFVSNAMRDEHLSRPEGIATLVLGGVRDRRAVEVLTGALGDENWLARIRAVRLLAELRNPESAGPLETLARSDEDEDVREQAIEALAAVAPEHALPILLQGLADADSGVRERAAALLGKLGLTQAIPALLRAMQDKEQDAALAAAEALEKLASAAR